jgi:two-component system chemotaxis response regulator CheY
MSEKTILIIDDEDDLRDTLKLSLELEGYRCYAAANGKEGLEALERIPPPSVILLDLMMPVLNGWQFLDALRAHPSFCRTPVVVVTAFIKQIGVIQAGDIIRKPVEMETLLEVVKKHCF